MKVYIVTQGSYSDYRIDRVFLDLEKAKTHASMISTAYEEARIEIYDTFDESVTVGNRENKTGEIIFCFTFIKDLLTSEWKLRRREAFPRLDYYEDFPKIEYESNELPYDWAVRYVYTVEPDEEKAWKILYDDIAKTKAQKEGL